jgi:hypothetical protein
MAFIAAAAALAVVAAGISAYSTYQQHEQEQQMARYQERLAERNRQIAEQQGEQAKLEARRHAEKFLHQQIAAFASTGAELTTGSPLALYSESIYQGELDAQKALYRSTLQAYGYKQQESYFDFIHDRARNTQWSDTILKGVSAGVSTYVGAGGTFGGRGGGPPTADQGYAGGGGYGVPVQDTTTGFPNAGTKIPRYRSYGSSLLGGSTGY